MASVSVPLLFPITGSPPPLCYYRDIREFLSNHFKPRLHRRCSRKDETRSPKLRVEVAYVGLKVHFTRDQFRRSEVTMGDFQALMPADAVELKDADAFKTVANGEGLISICGFGSLLSEKSARYTFPNLLNFRVAELRGFRRVFAHVAAFFFERGIANLATKEISSLSVEPCPGESIIVCVFEISLLEVPAFIEREHEFRFLAVTFHSLEGDASSDQAVICARYSDKEYREERCRDNDEYLSRRGPYNVEQIWRDDIFPCRVYLRHCVLAAKNLRQQAYDSFLDHTFLADRKTSIRDYLAADEKIMSELPPPSLRERYGG